MPVTVVLVVESLVSGLVARSVPGISPIAFGFPSTGAPVTTVRRAVLLGAQSCALAYGKGGGAENYMWNEELEDHKRVLEVSVMSMYGMKKPRFNSADFGTVVVSSYAAAHT